MQCGIIIKKVVKFMKQKINSKRLTIDLTNETKKILEELKSTLKKPFGQIVNQTISTVCDAPKDIKEETLAFFKNQIKNIRMQTDNASPYELHALSEKEQSYINLAMLMNNGKCINIDEKQKEPDMVRYEIESGYVIFPKDWIVVNPEMARKCYYAGVVECRRANYNIPHFLFFTNKASRDYDDELYKEVNAACCKAWSKFHEILQKQVEPIRAANGTILNLEEWNLAPTLGYFALFEQGDPALPANFEFPMGAMIVHNDNSKKYLNLKR